MSFDESQWVRDMVTGAIAGAATAVVGAAFVPDSSLVLALAAGGTTGLVYGVLAVPIGWVLKRITRRGSADKEEEPS